ncbi:MAG: response regulator [Pseudomonadota bacterium]
MRSDFTILVVDDHPSSLYAASKLLRTAGFKTLEAATGHDALHLSSQASALLLDVNLPDLNGVEVCHRIKSDKATAKPVILMSAVYADELHRDAGLQSGADMYVSPPLDYDAIAAAFDKLLAGSQGERSQ